MWPLLNKNCVDQKGIRDVESIKVGKSSSRGTMKTSVGRIKSPMGQTKSSVTRMMKTLIGRMKSLFWADEVAGWAQREVAIRAQIEAVIETGNELFSFFLLLACLPCLCLLCCCLRDEQCSGGGRMWWDHPTTVQTYLLGEALALSLERRLCLLKHFSHSY